MGRPLGSTQQSVLNTIRSHKRWHSGCGWLWTNYSETVRILESLVKRGLVKKSLTTGLMGATVDLYEPAEVDDDS